MPTISAGEFKAKCLKLMDNIAKSHEEYVITKRGVPIVKIVPLESELEPVGFLRNTVKIKGDIVSGDSDIAWEALKS